jgi:hypothetical protein
LSETISHLQRTPDGKLHPDSAAQAAIKALPLCETADKLERYEAQWELWRYTGYPIMRRFICWLAAAPLKIFRTEIAELATALQKELLAKKADSVQAGFYQEYVRLVDGNSELRKFLMQHFEPELDRATSIHKPLLDLCKEIMLNQQLAVASCEKERAANAGFAGPQH